MKLKRIDELENHYWRTQVIKTNELWLNNFIYETFAGDEIEDYQDSYDKQVQEAHKLKNDPIYYSLANTILSLMAQDCDTHPLTDSKAEELEDYAVKLGLSLPMARLLSIWQYS